MTQAKSGDTVSVNYTAKLDTGEVVQDTVDSGPLEFTIGSGEVIPGFEEAVMGMSPGETKTVTITAEKAYGPGEEDLVFELDRASWPPDVSLEIGQHISLMPSDAPDGGEAISARVADITESSVILDANHPLAGRDLVFTIELLKAEPQRRVA